MMTTDREGARAFLLFWTIVLFVCLIYLAFAHPDMTRMRLFLTYWYAYLAALGCAIGYALVRGR